MQLMLIIAVNNRCGDFTYSGRIALTRNANGLKNEPMDLLRSHIDYLMMSQANEI